MTDLEIQEQAENPAKFFLKQKGIHPTEPIYWDLATTTISLDDLLDEYAKLMQEQDGWIELKNETNEVPEMDCYFYNKTVGVVFIPKNEYVKIGLYTHYCPVTLPSPPKTK